MSTAIDPGTRKRATELLERHDSAMLRDMLMSTRRSWIDRIIREVLADRGCVQVRRARSSGTVVEVWQADQLGVSDSGGEWVTVCEHGSSCHHETRQRAIEFAAAPEVWCETDCRHAAEGKRCPGCGSTRMDFHGDNWICMGCGNEWPCNCSDDS